MNIYEQKKSKLMAWHKTLQGSSLGEQWAKAWEYIEHASFMTAPASTKYHLSVRGGLLIHSVCVTELAIRMLNTAPFTIPLEWVLAAGILHDIGKCGLLDEKHHQPRYTVNPRYSPRSASKWNAPYEWSPVTPEFTVRDLSALLVARWGFPWHVVQAVLVHDGAYAPENGKYAQVGCPLANLIMTADTLHAQTFESPDGIVVYEGDE